VFGVVLGERDEGDLLRGDIHPGNGFELAVFQ
jgi:hypothetical protein